MTVKPPSKTPPGPWAWVPSLYLAEGLPYVVVMTVAAIMYKGLGVSNTDLALYTSWLYLPWVLKPFWSPVVDILGTRRAWIAGLQVVVGGGLAALAFTLPTTHFFQSSLACLWLLAFSSATQDIAIDGFYLLATTEREQAYFVGVRSTFYRVATIFGQGLLVMLAGWLQTHSGVPGVAVVVRAAPEAPALRRPFLPPPALTTSPAGGPHLFAQPELVLIAPEPLPAPVARELLAAARSNNVHFGFRPAEAAPAMPSAAAPGNSPRPNALEAFLRARFHPPAKAAATAGGNLGLAFLRLSAPPARPVVVQVGPKANFGLGAANEKNFAVAEGARLTFTSENWSQPAAVVWQVDPKLHAATEAGFEVRAGNVPLSWSVTFGLLAVVFFLFAAYHQMMLPKPAGDQPGQVATLGRFWREFGRTFADFFRKERIGVLLLFLLTYRFAEAQLVKMVTPFLLDSRALGGLGLSPGQVGFAYGTVGILALTAGGLLGGFLAARNGLKFWLWPMVCAIHLPDAVFVWLATAQPDSFWLISLGLAVEQFGYGFGFAAYMLYMIRIARGRQATAHYAICTGFMALGMMVPGMFSGWLQEQVGYQNFFIWVLLATVPGFLVVYFIPLEADFGRRQSPDL